MHVETFRKIRGSICAVIRSEIQLWDRVGVKPIQTPGYSILGSGFIGKETSVVTNKHVFQIIQQQDRNHIGLLFVWYDPHTKEFHVTIKKIGKTFCVSNKSKWEDDEKLMSTDIAILEIFFESEEDKVDFHQRHPPLGFGENNDIQIGNQIAMCGYGHGDELSMLHNDPSTWRISPILHQGHISGMAPFDNVESYPILVFLTDISHGGGFSGSPIMLSDGRVIGVHCAGLNKDVLTRDLSGQQTWDRVPCGVGYAVPLSAGTAKNMLKLLVEWEQATEDAPARPLRPGDI